jgi:Helitron helicase-like domain at N-terminus
VQLKKLGSTLQCQHLKNKLEIALQNPNSKAAKETLQLIDPLLNITGSKVQGSPDERKSAISTLKSMIQFYRNPSIFFTSAPDDTHSLLTLRMCCPTVNGNDKFPAVDDGFEKYMRERRCENDIKHILDDQIDISELNLHYLLSKNPVAAGEVFKLTLETIFEVLFGIRPEHIS